MSCQRFQPLHHRVAAAHAGLHQAIDHEGRRYVYAVLPGVLGMPFHRLFHCRFGERLAQWHAAVTFQAGNDVVGCGIHVRAAGVMLELEGFTVRRHRGHYCLGLGSAAFEAGGSKNATHHHRRVYVPGLRLQANLHRDTPVAGLGEQSVELVEILDRKRARGLQEYLEAAGPVASGQYVCVHDALLIATTGRHAAATAELSRWWVPDSVGRWREEFYRRMCET